MAGVESPPPRVVLDTSVLFSAHRHWLWLLARRGYFRGTWSTFIVGELVRIRVEHSIARGLQRPVYRQRVNQLIHLLSDVLLVADYRSADAGGLISDPDDEPNLATALAGRAAYIVTLDTRDFPLGAVLAQVPVMTPQDFLAELAALRPNALLPQQADDAGRQLP